MSDQFTEVTTEGWGSRLGGSLVAALSGLSLLPAAMSLLRQLHPSRMARVAV